MQFASLPIIFILYFLLAKVFFLLNKNSFLLSKVKKEKLNLHIKEFPNVSVVIPMKDEVENAEECVQAVLSQNYPGDYEIVVCLPDEKDSTNSVLSKFSTNKKISIIYSFQAGKAVQMYKAVSKSKYDTIASLDADCRPQKVWLKTMVILLKNSNLDSISGWQYIEESNPLNVAQFYDNTLLLSVILPANYIWTGNNIIKRETYFQCRGGLRYAQDMISDCGALYKELNEEGKNHNITLNPKTLVKLAPKKNLKDYYKQKIRWSTIYLHRIRLGMIINWISLFFGGAFFKRINERGNWVFMFFGIYIFFFIGYFFVPKDLHTLYIALIAVYYFIDIFFIRLWAKKMNLKISSKGFIYYLITVFIELISYYTAISYLLLGKTEKWKGGKHKE
jgi:glycosyltransferase involved in cell wall biosynthesis